MKKIPLSRGKFAIVDDEDYFAVNKMNWFKSGRESGGHIVITEIFSKGKRVKTLNLHRFVLGLRNGVKVGRRLVRFKNKNKFDCRKENLFLLSEVQKCASSDKRKNCSSKFKGVCFLKSSNLWLSYIGSNKNKTPRTYLGRFKIEEEAAHAYNKKARELYGEFAYQNII